MPNTAQRDTSLRSTASPAFWKVSALKVGPELDDFARAVERGSASIGTVDGQAPAGNGGGACRVHGADSQPAGRLLPPNSAPTVGARMTSPPDSSAR